MTLKEFLKVKLEPAQSKAVSKVTALRKFSANLVEFVRSEAPKSDLIG